MTRNAGFVLSEQRPDFRKRFFFRVIEAEPFLFLRFEAFEGGVQGARERCDVALAVRIGGLELRHEELLRRAIASFILAKLFEAAAGADGIDVPLGKNGAEPGVERAASGEVAEERPFRPLVTGQTIQLRKNGIREITGFRGTRFAAENGSCRRAQVTAISGEKMLPGVFDSLGASGGQGKIFEMQAAEILFELLGCYRFRRQGFLRAALERGGESFLRKAPAARLGLGVEPLQESSLAVERPGEIHRGILTAAFWRVFSHL